MELEIVPMPEQILKTEKASSYGGNHSELSNGLPEVEANHGALFFFFFFFVNLHRLY